MYYCWQYHNVTWIQKVINFYLSVLKILFFCLNELDFSGVFFTFIPENHYFKNTSFLKRTNNSFRIFCTFKVSFFYLLLHKDFCHAFFSLIYSICMLFSSLHPQLDIFNIVKVLCPKKQ